MKWRATAGRRNLGILLLASALMSAVVTPVAVAADDGFESGEAVDAVLLDNPDLRREAGQIPTIDLIGENLSATVVLTAEAFFDADMADLEGSEVFDREIELVRHDSSGNVASRSGERVVVGDNESRVSTVIEGYVDGLRMVEVIEARNSAHKFSYGASVDGREASFLVQDDGSIVIGWGTKKEFSAVGQVDAPWAYDGDGQPVPVSYKVTENGRTLTLSVARQGDAAYPITADPSFTFWAGEVHCSWGSCTFYLERAKTYWIRNVFATQTWAIASTLTVAAACGWIAAAMTLSSGIGGAITAAGCSGVLGNEVWKLQYHADQGWSCLTFKKPYWRPWLTVGHASGSSSHCHYNA